ncbi:putative alpha-galactosidase B [Aspergillus sclerotioniger CBS 115572]|uniref:Alpha-galactosidase n=1 Tax=Aspergillus sclerotioniger CBS 115572 TaxID=1450535 RepID=A0A317VAC7_9EURO|nr:putative alpha-galactosidase B [Aspergillus sclerotioniger CBS 115572]PWY70309.1 putative alpha-galactosidase B [Aspergillus sclerotioniger CBS 115572]
MRSNNMWQLLISFLLLSRAAALVRPDDVGRVPALGWNSWNAYNCEIDADKILTAANEVVNLGLKSLGYEYINIDDCWSVKSGRDPTTKRIIPDPDKFPNGISGVADQVHALGLKLGIYSSAGLTTCAGYPASLGYEEIDAQSFAEWGVDCMPQPSNHHSPTTNHPSDLKYDNCGVPTNLTDQYTYCVPDSTDGSSFPNGTCDDLTNAAPDNYNWATSTTAKRYMRMRNALLNVNRTILYSLCDWGQADVNDWGNATGNSWRMSGDITPSWTRIAEIANENSFLMNYADFWGYPDPDMLEVGNGNLTLAENRAHFALWAVMKSPLIIGTPVLPPPSNPTPSSNQPNKMQLSSIDKSHLTILSNAPLLTFHQDPQIGRPAYPYKWGYNADWTFDPSHPAEYWSGPSSSTALNGTLVLMLNSQDTVQTRTAYWKEVPELKGGYRRGGGYRVTDAWTGNDLGCVRDKYSTRLGHMM